MMASLMFRTEAQMARLTRSTILCRDLSEVKAVEKRERLAAD
jgi:hypothetical protein